ncbi:hypothetical protein B0J11DRAFT_614637 [Dendryphion nanum]|uniref:F-box domain-containing protein n=1 Tax=Dendryphion nanum TaxID=256645 RepID=A0A9P9DR78_9PLEO|nr:hypothetical protein B0J11DRAFT_614637 [Dendryphion nanum]
MSHVLELSLELLEAIANELPPRSAFAMAQTCKDMHYRLYRILESHKVNSIKWKTINLGDYEEKPMMQLLYVLSQEPLMGPYVEQIVFQPSTTGNNRYISDFYTFQDTSKLEAIRSMICESGYLAEAGIDQDDWCRRIGLSTFPSLTYSFAFEYFITLLLFLPLLRHLDLRCLLCGIGHFYDILNWNPDAVNLLTHLISKARELSIDTAQLPMTTRLSQGPISCLKSLKLTGELNLDTQLIAAEPFLSLPSLTTLELSRFYVNVDPSYEDIPFPDISSKLRTLTMRECDVHLHELVDPRVSFFHRLHHLESFHYDHSSEDPLDGESEYWYSPDPWDVSSFVRILGQCIGKTLRHLHITVNDHRTLPPGRIHNLQIFEQLESFVLPETIQKIRLFTRSTDLSPQKFQDIFFNFKDDWRAKFLDLESVKLHTPSPFKLIEDSPQVEDSWELHHSSEVADFQSCKWVDECRVIAIEQGVDWIVT